MQDRATLYPGRVKLTPVSGQENTYDMVRADQPTQEGTKLSKATLFDAAAEKAIFNDENGNHTPAEAFVALPNVLESIGTIKTTVRTDLGEKWLLCNGAGIDPTEYPELSAVLLQSQPITGEWTAVKDTPFTNALRIVYRNGYWVVCGQSSNSSYPYPYIWYATSIQGPWTAVKVSSYYQAIYDIEYFNGYWVVSAKTTKTSGYYNVYLYYATSLDGPWTSYQVYSQNSYGTIPRLAVGNGYIVCMYGSVDSYTYIRYTTNLAGSWSNKQVSTSSAENIRFVDGKFCIVGSSTKLFYATLPSDTWTSIQISTATSNNLRDIVKVKDTFVALANYGTAVTGPARVFYSTDLTSTNWSNVKIVDGSGKSIIVVDDSYIIVAASIYNSASNYTKNLYMLEYGSLSTVTNLATFGTMTIDSTFYGAFYGAVVELIGNALYYLPHGLLPSISTNLAYTYIKAKE